MTTLTCPSIRIGLKRILVATDFSPLSRRAMDYALSFARRYESTILAAHVISPAMYATPSTAALYGALDPLPYLDGVRRELQHRLDELTLYAIESGVKCQSVLVEGGVPEEIKRLVEDRDIDLLVVGTHGAERWNRLVMGSVAESLVHNATCPVLTIGPKVFRRPRFEASLKHILYATDFSAEATHAAPYALSLAQEFGARITLVHVLPPELRSNADRDRLTQHFREELEKLVPADAQNWCEPECLLECGGSVEGIVELAEQRAADLIVLGTRKSNAGVLTYFKSGVAYRNRRERILGLSHRTTRLREVPMWRSIPDLLNVLETELEFLNRGGYRNPDVWRAQFTFLDSPTCAHPASAGRPDACKDCLLMPFVPVALRHAAMPCHYIPLTADGLTIGSLHRWGTQQELEDALRSWLERNIAQLKRSLAVSQQSRIRRQAPLKEECQPLVQA